MEVMAMRMKEIVATGLVSVALGCNSSSEYFGGGIYSCERFVVGDDYCDIARLGDDKSVTFCIYPNRVNMVSENIDFDEGIKAIKLCQEAYYDWNKNKMKKE